MIISNSKEELKKFENWLTVNNKASSTVSKYVHNLQVYFEQMHNILDEDSVQEFTLNLKKNMQEETVNGYLRALSSFLRFKNLDMRLPKQSTPIKKVPDFIDKEEFDEIIVSLPHIFTYTLKAKAILYLCFYTGLRLSEIASLKRENFDLNKRTLKIYEKKKKQERIVIIPKIAANVIKAYFFSEDQELGKTAFNISYEGIKSMIKKLKKYFPEKNIRPNLFRHSYATYMLDNGMDMKRVSYFLGHVNINTTQRYLGNNIKQMKFEIDSIFKNK